MYSNAVMVAAFTVELVPSWNNYSAIVGFSNIGKCKMGDNTEREMGETARENQKNQRLCMGAGVGSKQRREQTN